MTQPTLTVELGYLSGWTLGTSLLGTDTYLAEVTYDQDISDLVRSVSIRRGRQHELNRVEAGTASVMVLNQDGAMTRIPPMTAIRIRATYPPPVTFSPSDISGLTLWYDFSSAATMFTDTARTALVAADGAEVRGIADLSGNAHHLEGAGPATTYPLYKTSIQNGLSVLRFNGNDEIRTTANITWSTDYTIFIVAGRVSTAGTQALWTGDSGAGSRVIQTRYENAANTATIIPRPGTGSSTSVTTSAAPIKDVLSFTVQSNTVNGATARANGVAGTATNAPVTLTTAREYRLGWDEFADALTGDICEVVQYDSLLSAANHNIVGNYLQAKWATPAWTTV